MVLNKTIFIECRSRLDNTFKPDHYRRLINGNHLLATMYKMWLHIKYFREGRNVASYNGENPIIIRLIARQ